MVESIKLHLVLSELDDSITPDGKPKTFSITFIQKDGGRSYIHRAIKIGLNMDLKKNAMRGILPVNKDGDKISHPTPVWIWSIVEFNGRKVYI